MINEYSLNPDWYIKNNLDPSQDLFKVYDRILEEHLKFDQRYDFCFLFKQCNIFANNFVVLHHFLP